MKLIAKLALLTILITATAWAEDTSPREYYYQYQETLVKLRSQHAMNTDEGRKQFMAALEPHRAKTAAVVDAADPESLREDDLYFACKLSTYVENKEKCLALHRAYLSRFPRGLFVNLVRQELYKRLTYDNQVEAATELLPQIHSKLVENYYENLSHLAWAHARQKNNEEALKVYNKILDETVRRAGHEPLPNYRLARLLPSMMSLMRDMGKEKEAVALFKDAFPKLEKAPDVQNRIKTIIASSEIMSSPAPELNVERWVNADGFVQENLKGKVVLLDFWATWCGPCIKAFPKLKELQEHYPEDSFAVVGLTKFYGTYRGKRNLTKEQESEKIRDEFVPQYKLPWPLGIAEGDDLFKSFGVTNLPTIFVIDKKGIIRERLVGNRPEHKEKLMALIDKLIEE